VFYAIVGLLVLVSIGLALYALFRKSELEAALATLQEEFRQREARDTDELVRLRTELAKLERLSHIPGVIERAKKTEQEIEAKVEQARIRANEIISKTNAKSHRIESEIADRMEEAQTRAYEVVQSAVEEANGIKERLVSASRIDAAMAEEARKTAEREANLVVEEARKKAKEIASQARKDAKEKTQKVEDTLDRATAYAMEIRARAEQRAEEIGREAYEALKRHDFYAAAAQAMENVVTGYGGTYKVPAAHMFDELADEYGFHRAGEMLKVARERTRVMEKNGTAATCNYSEGWKKDYAINFVLSAFNGKVDSILARLKPVNQGKLVQEIEDAFALVNNNGVVFRNARIQEEYLEARLEELKWAVAVQRVKEREREEQRAIREQIREEEKARKEYEKAIKQAERDERLLTEALEKVRQQYDAAAVDDRAKYESQLQDLAAKLQAAEEKNQRALSMAQQTKSGHVYVISNVGSFGEGVYKIGLTRRLEPLERVRELGDASVPFAFDVHAMIHSQDAPALETALHRRFVQCQVNKVNRRKEFFRLRLQDIRDAVDEMKYEVKWTLAAEARDYRETLEMERHMQEDPEYRKRWVEEQRTYAPLPLFEDEEGAESVTEDDRQSLAEDLERASDVGAAVL